jgi:hypothetical protein
VYLQDPQWIKFPRWIDCSGLPQVIVETLGSESWLILRKLIEIDCEQNLTPDWFMIDLADLSFQTGLKQEAINNNLLLLEENNRILRLDTDLHVQNVKIDIPLQVPLEENEIKANLVQNQYKPGHFVMRYYKDMNYLEPVEKVIYLYQMLFGAKFNPKIVQDLEEIANFYDMAVIYDIFNQAYEKKVKSLSWIKSHLDKELKINNDNYNG